MESRQPGSEHHRRRVISPPGLIAIDVGNSRIKYGWFQAVANGTEAAWPECRHFAATGLSAPAPWDQIRTWTDPLTCGVAIAGSNPAVVEQTAMHWQTTTGRTPWVVRDRHCLPVRMAVEFPEKVGLDRLLNAVAANQLRSATEGVIVVDSGTATTVDVVTPEGCFAGGAILPGFALSSRALHLYTALLPELSVAELGPEPPSAIGKQTRSALRSGIFWGQIGAVRQLIEQICSELDWQSPLTPADRDSNETRCRLVLTGGGGPWLETQLQHTLHVPSLAMYGLVLTAWSQGVGA